MTNSKLIAVFGVGGVGKTTTSASLGLALASQNKKVAIITVDPAKRLAQIMGLQSLSSKPQRVFKDTLNNSKGYLDALWVDSASVLEDIVLFHKSKFTNPESIIHNRLFKVLQSQLGGIEEYLGLEKLLELKNSGDYDYCILDTPPSQQGIDYLDAPRHIVQFLEEGVLKYFLSPSETSRPSSVKGFLSAAFSFGSENALTLFKKFLGESFLTELAELLTALSPLKSVFINTAEQSQLWFSDSSTKFLVISSLEKYPFEEAGRIRNQISNRFPDANTQFIYNKVLPHSLPKQPWVATFPFDQWMKSKHQHQMTPNPNDIKIPIFAQSELNSIKLLEIGEEIIKQWKKSSPF
jgi:anion-transporting  ArsA/GET3 family ATPase